MSENKKKFEAVAKEFFADAKNSNVNKVYITSDGNMFRAEHYADGWKTNLKNQEVEVYEREQKAKAIESEDDDTDATKSTTIIDTTGDAVRAELVKQYIELFDTKPSHNIGLEKLQDKITAKRLELEKANPSTVKHIVTEEGIKNNPELTEEGVNVGDEIEIPAE